MPWADQELKLQPAGDACKLRAILYDRMSSEDLLLPKALTFAGLEVSRICEANKLLLRIENEKPDLVVVTASVNETATISTLLKDIASACTTERFQSWSSAMMRFHGMAEMSSAIACRKTQTLPAFFTITELCAQSLSMVFDRCQAVWSNGAVRGTFSH